MPSDANHSLSPPRRILYVVPFSDIGGSEQLVLDHLRCLDRSRYEPLLASLRPGAIGEAARNLGVTTYELHPHKTRELHRVIQAIAQLSRIIRREKIDLVFANQGNMLLYCGLAAAPLHRPVVWMVHDPLKGEGLFERAFVLAQRRIKPSWVIASSEGTMQSYLATYPNIGSHSVITPGVDSVLLESGADASRARRTLGIPEGAPLFSVLARLQSSKGHLHLIEAVPRVLPRFPDARFVIVGDTQSDIQPEYKTEIRQAIDHSGLADSILMAGYVSDALKRDILAATTAVVHPATWEPFGIAVIEGMAVGKPVIAAESAGPKQIVVDSVTGYLVPRADSAALAEAILKILDSPQKAAAMGNAGRQRVQEHYRTREKVRQVEAVFDAVFAGLPHIDMNRRLP